MVSEAASDPLKFRLRVICGVDTYATFGPTERDLKKGAFVGHKRGEGLNFIEMHGVPVADPAFVWAEDIIVLNPITLEELKLPIIHADREVHDDLILGLSKDSASGLDTYSDGECVFELSAMDLIKVVAFYNVFNFFG